MLWFLYFWPRCILEKWVYHFHALGLWNLFMNVQGWTFLPKDTAQVQASVRGGAPLLIITPPILSTWMIDRHNSKNIVPKDWNATTGLTLPIPRGFSEWPDTQRSRSKGLYPGFLEGNFALPKPRNPKSLWGTRLVIMTNCHYVRDDGWCRRGKSPTLITFDTIDAGVTKQYVFNKHFN